MRHGDVTVLLQRLKGGDESAGEALFEVVYGDLHDRARRMLGSGAGHTLQATALIHEAWLKLDHAGSDPGDRGHFLAIAAKAMRSVLVDHARAKSAAKRPDSRQRVLLDEALAVYADRVPDVLELNDELDRLAELDARLARIVELRFFGGLSIAETADVMQLGHATVERGWQSARAWLASRLGPDGAGPKGAPGADGQ
ncbi:ECF-type sigma factor [Engelhardtia mirabilis]|uniref:RNA polymerase sigma factor n=1 Tax=Engelhardtia mirabilis TaxID=2528011 RepID=A0A518BES0_9BACT|nr:RNA polymerase sigma factor [Planctomycetes bacterium Pla133]QDU99709.1 RNA polymerase sigma factor [Planctomycetes bacterium Pla86]